jgi:hypothetical protein
MRKLPMSRRVPRTAIFAPRSADCVARVDEELVNSDQLFVSISMYVAQDRLHQMLRLHEQLRCLPFVRQVTTQGTSCTPQPCRLF